VVAIFITTSDAGGPAPLEAVSAIYNLTPAESQVAALLGDGLSRAEIAQRTGVAISTVKTHLSQLLLKTGCRRQGELIALLSTLRPPIQRQA
jgi:DNA-binding CsgD family transcriptional regulator